MQDLYATLGIDKSATDEEIKAAHRRLVREHHPDRNPGDEAAEETFKEIQSAYDVLGDSEKRAAYDQSRLGPIGGRFDPGAYADFDLGDLFGGLFGGGGGRRASSQPVRGRDLETIVNLSFEDSLQGLTIRVPVDAEVACASCHGTGGEGGAPPAVCPECRGRGVVSDNQGPFAISQPCPTCHGNGTIVENPCSTCHGTGRERRTKRYQVKIPAGAKDGTKVRLPGRGEPGRNGGPSGDLYVTVQVADSPLFERRGADLLIDVPVTFSEATLGTEVEVPTPNGRVSLKVPEGTESGTLLRIRGQGAPRLNGGGPGDLLARIRLTVPKRLSAEEREAIENLQSVSREKPREAFES